MFKFKSRSEPGAPRRALGIDIGAETLRLVSLADRPDGPAVEWGDIVSLSADAVKDGIVVKRREVATQIRRLLREHSCAATAAAVAVPVDQAVVRWIDLPVMNADALAAATPYEARKYLPYPPDQAEIRILPMQTYEEAGKTAMRSLLVAAPRDVVGSRAETLEMAGLRVACVEIEPFALVRALDRPDRWRGAFWRGQSQGYLQIGHRATGLYVMQDAAPKFVRSIVWGNDRLIQAVMECRGCTAAQARAMLETSNSTLDEGGLNEPFSVERADNNVSGAITVELDRLCREIERLLSYYRSLYPERSYAGAISRLVLCGDVAGIVGLDRYLARALQLDVSAEHPFQTLIDSASVSMAEALAGREHRLAVACGLALGQLAQEAYAERAGRNEVREFIWRYRAA